MPLHRSNCCYAAILIRNIDSFLIGLKQECIELSALAIILQVAFLSCTGMLTVMTSSLHKIKLKLNTCFVPRNELVE